MHKKSTISFILLFLFQIVVAQNEFITVWKPSTIQTSPLQTGGISSGTQIFFPLRGSSFNISWEEIGYPSHNANLTNLSSNLNTLIDFGTPLNPDPNNATYRIKVSGSYSNIRFVDSELYPLSPAIVGDTQKILKVEQWGNNQWSTMNEAFTACYNLDVPATDIPDLSNVTSMNKMFTQCYNLVSNTTINNWNISNVTDISKLFFACYLFNQSVENWNTSNVKNMDGTFAFCLVFNKPLASWNTSKVISSATMFQNAANFNQPIGSWDMSKNRDMEFMFFMASSFNQPIGGWNTSELLTAHYMFFNATNFNQDIGNWDVSKVTRTESMFQNATSFNQSLANWNLNALLTANLMLNNTGLDCQNYSKTLRGWGTNSNIATNVNLGSVAPAVYSTEVSVHRNTLLTKGWQITGDNPGECSLLSTSESGANIISSIYPNPASDFIYLKNFRDAKSYKIFDASGREILKDEIKNGIISVHSLISGNYILQVISKDKIQNLKFIKK